MFERLGHPIEILLIEDNPSNLELATLLLESSGYTVTPAMSGFSSSLLSRRI